LTQKSEFEELVKQEEEQTYEVLDQAGIPTEPVRPQLSKILLMAIFLGLASGGGLAGLAEMMDRSLHDTKTAERELGLPVLCALPPVMSRWRTFRRATVKAVLALGCIALLGGYGILLLYVRHIGFVWRIPFLD
jgi:hypothetical protein